VTNIIKLIFYISDQFGKHRFLVIDRGLING